MFFKNQGHNAFWWQTQGQSLALKDVLTESNHEEEELRAFQQVIAPLVSLNPTAAPCNCNSFVFVELFLRCWVLQANYVQQPLRTGFLHNINLGCSHSQWQFGGENSEHFISNKHRLCILWLQEIFSQPHVQSDILPYKNTVTSCDVTCLISATSAS